MQRSERAATAAGVPAAAGPLPSLRQLRYLVVLADRLHFRAAADACFVTQSTLSAGIKELENQLGAQLVERDKRSVRLTPTGAAVVERARLLVAQAADLVTNVAASREPFAAPFRLGAIPTVAPFLFPRVLPTLLQMVEGGLGVTLLPGLAVRAGLLKSAALVARPFAAPVPARTIVLAARASSARGKDLNLLAALLSEQGSA